MSRVAFGTGLASLALAACVSGASEPKGSYGEAQLAAVMKDRPMLARSLEARPEIRAWIIGRFDEIEPPLVWDPSEPVSGRGAEFDARDPEVTYVRVSPDQAGIDQLTTLLFELHNVEGYEVFDEIHERAVAGEITKEEYATLNLQQEFQALMNCREFLAENLDDLTRRERSEARRYYRLRHGPDTLEGHLKSFLEQGHDLKEHFRKLWDDYIIPEREG